MSSSRPSFAHPIFASPPQLCCSQCHETLPHGGDPIICRDCGLATCGRPTCDDDVAKQRHAIICKEARFDHAYTLVEKLLEPIEKKMESDKEGEVDYLYLSSLLQLAMDVIGPKVDRTMLSKFYDALRAGSVDFLMEYAATCKGKSAAEGKEIPNMAEIAMDMRRRMALDTLNEPFTAALFGAHVLAAQAYHPDTLAQLALLYKSLWDARYITRLVCAGIASDEEAMNVKAPYRIFQLLVDQEENDYRCYQYCPRGINSVLLDCFKEDLNAAAAAAAPLNMVWLLTLEHLQKGEALACLKNTKQQRPASTQIMVRLMGARDDPVLLVLQTHTTLYNLQRWLTGELFTGNDQKSAADASNRNEFHTLSTEDRILASQRKHYTDHYPGFGGSRRREIRGLTEVYAFARAVDTLCNKNVITKEREAAYTTVTGVIWPSGELNPFSLLAVRANLVA